MRILMILLFLPFFMSAQEKGEKENSLFVALYTVGDSWDSSKPPSEQLYFKDHSVFLKKLRDEGKITMGARYSDTGMVIFKASDIETAKKLINSDTAVHHQLFNVEVHAFAPFYKGCIE